MSIIFISDVHLNIQTPKVTAGFLHFLQTRVMFSQALYILGDLFETWIGDDDPNPLHEEISIALNILNIKGIDCYFIHGNRDFLLGKHYATECNMKLLPQQYIISFNKFRIVILHGDILCTKDKKYQYFRYMIRNNLIQKLFLFLPIKYRKFISDIIRTHSIKNNQKKHHILNIDRQKVIKIMYNTNTTIMIHGHTHQLALHILSGRNYRVVLGSWDNYGSSIEITNSNIILHQFPLYKE